jgi:hypothetical protein
MTKKILLSAAFLFSATAILAGSDVCAKEAEKTSHHVAHHAGAKKSSIGTLSKPELAHEIIKGLKSLEKYTKELEDAIEAKAKASKGDNAKAWQGIADSYKEKNKGMEKHYKAFEAFLEEYVM